MRSDPEGRATVDVNVADIAIIGAASVALVGL